MHTCMCIEIKICLIHNEKSNDQSDNQDQFDNIVSMIGITITCQ